MNHLMEVPVSEDFYSDILFLSVLEEAKLWQLLLFNPSNESGWWHTEKRQCKRYFVSGDMKMPRKKKVIIKKKMPPPRKMLKKRSWVFSFLKRLSSLTREI